LSDVSCAAYRKIVREDERFVPYFRSATPELELSQLNIGSRPAKRNATGGVESLRAIVSVFVACFQEDLCVECVPLTHF
jgi:phosphoenolpyruvate carboxylase